MPSAPAVSIVLPTFNRGDTILRAVRSILAQTFADWELELVDDGSTDGTQALVSGLDPRIRIHRQENGGLASARNRGLRESRGRYIAFLDSDDEWLPHHLALCVAFLRANPAEHLVSGEFWIDRGDGAYEKHFRVSMGGWFVGLARQIRSRSLDLPEGETDDYLRFYSSRQDLPEWGREVLAPTPYASAQLYRGDLFQKWRWGYLLAAQPTVFTRAAMERVGPFDESYTNASDFGYLATLCRLYPAWMISAPSCIKHEYAAQRKPLAEDHLATGKKALAFAKDLLRWHEELFWNDRPYDPELSALRALCQLFVARVALGQGLAREAVAQLDAAIPLLPDYTPSALRLLAGLAPDGAGARRAYAMATRLGALPSRLRGKVSQLLGRGQTRPIS